MELKPLIIYNFYKKKKKTFPTPSWNFWIMLKVRGWVPKFATGIYIIRRNAFIFNFLTRLDYKHKNWLISNFLNAFYLFWSAMWTPPYKSQWLVCSIWVQNVTNRTLNFEIFFCLQHRAYIKRLHNMYHLKFKNHYGWLRNC